MTRRIDTGRIGIDTGRIDLRRIDTGRIDTRKIDRKDRHRKASCLRKKRESWQYWRRWV